MQIEENMFMQYFLGYSSFTNEYPFSATLFLEIRKRLDLSIINSISEIVVTHQKEIEEKSLKRKGVKGIKRMTTTLQLLLNQNLKSLRQTRVQMPEGL